MLKSVLIVRGTCHDVYESAWSRALGDLGVPAQVFDTHAFFPTGLGGRVEHRMLWGPHVAAVNRRLIRLVAESRPEVTLLYQGHHYWPETVDHLRRQTFVVGYHNDDPFGPRRNLLRYRHLRRGLPRYHGYHVYRECNLHEMIRMGVENVAMLPSYYLPWCDRPMTLSAEERARFGCQLTFVGHCERDLRVECLSAAVRSGIHVRLHGQPRFWRPALPRDVYRALAPLRPRHGDEYRKALCGAEIAACFFSRWNRDQYTRRVFEIPACGVFLLAERTPVMCELYGEGSEAEFFASPEEFLDKLRFYLTHPAARKRIAEAGSPRPPTVRESRRATARI